MPKVEKTVQGDAMTVAGKLKVCIGAFGKLTSLRDQWETECDGKKCILQVYEKKSLEEEGRHFTLTVVLFDTGKEVRIMVKPEVVTEDNMILLARDIAKKIEAELEYPGQIKVNVIRETKAVEFAK